MIQALQMEAEPLQQVTARLHYWLELKGIKNPLENGLAISVECPTIIQSPKSKLWNRVNVNNYIV